LPYLKEEIKAGIIIITAFLVLSLVVIVIGGKNFFKSYDYYYVQVKNITGIDVGSQVKLAGVTVGSIVDIKPPQSPGDFVTLKIGLNKGTKLFKGTEAVVSQIGFIGEIFLLLTVDKTFNQHIVPGSTIPSSERAQFSTLLGKLDDLSNSVNNLVTDIDKIFSPKNISNIESILANTNNLMGGASSNVDKISTSLHDVTSKLSTVLVEMKGLVKDSKGGLNDILKKSSVDLEKTGDMIKAIEQAANSMGKTSSSAGNAINLQNNNINELLKSMTKTSEDLQEVLQGLKNRPWSIIYKEGKGDEEK
jgi:phospholipid/cholesterol/gamma-HCH transport system substrate-binding protein